MQMRKALLAVTAAVVMMTGLTGCFGNKDMTAKGIRTNSVRYDGHNGINPYNDANYNTGRNNVNNGYRGGYNTYGTDYDMGRNTYDANNYNRYGTNMGRNYNANGNTNGNSHGFKRMQSSQKIADKINAIPGVKTANVFVTDNNAYVAVTTDSNSHMNQGTNKVHPYSLDKTYTRSTNHAKTAILNDDLKSIIGKEVKKMAPECNNVYVSADANFVDRMNQYATYAKQGHPLHGLNVEFQELVGRIFPTNEAPNHTRNMAPGMR
ncbi:YhcN/YlaJ family sporulation lipoprotein [Paenibacillus sp. UMB4589-SE434]|uniref:YhcN/YlaJ family sporulation lipoprotein n=1 Tax=Paenibacillus sp. UMB4589-SE434 TaxID=3046314 RepID=UPI00255012D5|nr:YhcN/YlaJ family sporulation lipoprotein [Paenibacillus sp. UMB4589-SE434]MDK8183683.1 YhcN/YlaJ family sporulation lipoprotein [Paenibacillus sp. UMB4589-SE434]